jgi:hypothetical protein
MIEVGWGQAFFLAAILVFSGYNLGSARQSWRALKGWQAARQHLDREQEKIVRLLAISSAISHLIEEVRRDSELASNKRLHAAILNLVAQHNGQEGNTNDESSVDAFERRPFYQYTDLAERRN